MASAAFVTDTTEIITQATEAAAGIAGILNAFKIIDLQRKYFNLYKQQRDFYYSTFQVGVETPLAQDTYADPAYNLNYAGRVAGVYSGFDAPFSGNITDTRGWWERHAAVYSSVPDANMEVELAADLARIKTDWTNYMLRFEEHFFDVTNDIRWQKRLMVHNIGMKQGTAISAALDSSLGNFTDHLNNFGDQLATYGNGAAKYSGYRRGLSDTSDDFGRMEYYGAYGVNNDKEIGSTKAISKSTAPGYSYSRMPQ